MREGERKQSRIIRRCEGEAKRSLGKEALHHDSFYTSATIHSRCSKEKKTNEYPLPLLHRLSFSLNFNLSTSVFFFLFLGSSVPHRSAFICPFILLLCRRNQQSHKRMERVVRNEKDSSTNPVTLTPAPNMHAFVSLHQRMWIDLSI